MTRFELTPEDGSNLADRIKEAAEAAANTPGHPVPELWGAKVEVAYWDWIASDFKELTIRFDNGMVLRCDFADDPEMEPWAES